MNGCPHSMTDSSTDESSDGTDGEPKPKPRCVRWCSALFRRNGDSTSDRSDGSDGSDRSDRSDSDPYRQVADTELEAMIQQRDNLNASIEEQMRRQGVELPLSIATNPTLHMRMSFLTPAVEKLWRTEGCQDQIVLGSAFLALCEVLLRAAVIWKNLWYGCGIIGLDKSRLLRASIVYNVVLFFALVPLLVLNLNWKSKRLHMTLVTLAYMDRVASFFPLLHFACGRKGRHEHQFDCAAFPDANDCQRLQYFQFQNQMFSVMAQVVVLPEYRYFPYMWIWIFVATLVSSVISMNDDLDWTDARDAKNEFFVRLLLLSLVQVVANRKKIIMEEQNRALFLTNNKSKEVSLSMFKVLELMVPDFVVLPLLQEAQQVSSACKVSYRFDCASVLFIAFDDFESTVQQKTPPEILQFLNHYYNQFDMLCATNGVTKVETVAEEYVCAVGIQPGSESEDVQEALSSLILVASEVLSYEGVSFKMGMHTGPVVAGVVGNKLPRYCLFGDTINTAARMMQRGQAGELLFGEATRALLPSWVTVTCRGEVEMKGKGRVMVYSLAAVTAERRRPARIPKHPLRTTKALFSALQAGKRTAEGAYQGPSSDFNDMLEVLHSRSQKGCRHCLISWCPGWEGFPAELEKDYRKWYSASVLADNFSKFRLRRQAMFLCLLTIVEACYMLFMHSSFTSFHRLGTGLIALRFYFMLRAVAASLSLAMSYVCPPLISWGQESEARRWKAKLGSQAGHLLLVSLMMLSYILLPPYANMGLLAVPDNVVALMTLPVYAALMMSYQQDFLTSVVFLLTFALTLLVIRYVPETEGNGYPSEGLTFLGYSLIFVLKAYMGERSLRNQFKARHGIDDAKRRIEGILETMMPPKVLEELQKTGPGSCPPSHHYFRATLVQSDLVGFTRMASSKPPEAVVKAVSDLFGMFDDLADEYGIYKVETVGDAYIAGQAEPPLTLQNYPPNVIRFGLNMVQVTQSWSSRSGESIGVRVGLHTGECIGGIVGIDRQRYHLFGKLIHQLELLESTAPDNRVQASRSCRLAVEKAGVDDAEFEFVERPEPSLLTSKGEVHQYAEVGGQTHLVNLLRPLPRRQQTSGLWRL